MNVYGVFLRPDTITAMAVSTVTFHVRRQFGLVSAGAFPPHATLAGSVPIGHEPARVVAALDPVIATTSAFVVHNRGIVTLRSAIVYDIDQNVDGTRNGPLHRLADDVNSALQPLTSPLEAKLVTDYDPARFHAHLSLASHELALHPEIAPDVNEFIREVPVAPSAAFVGSRVALYRFWSDGWDGNWWESLRWTQEHSWRLGES
ncbi:2'-5' RNA ligase family protein [Leifsonia aquatica]|uniref:2'-5' RNA ligase family protein n=1 Tax=Leifsonia aquatica TaxID=144185 RepID=UPI00384ECF8A